jgi:hypothetical protein
MPLLLFEVLDTDLGGSIASVLSTIRAKVVKLNLQTRFNGRSAALWLQAKTLCRSVQELGIKFELHVLISTRRIGDLHIDLQSDSTTRLPFH